MDFLSVYVNVQHPLTFKHIAEFKCFFVAVTSTFFFFFFKVLLFPLLGFGKTEALNLSVQLFLFFLVILLFFLLLLILVIHFNMLAYIIFVLNH